MSERRFVIVGTAGHIDHGKTALVEALTGKNTDRLKEEKERGISIDIDFAPLLLADDTLIGVIDVPGHERFVRNMVAGAAGIDVALLVIDINEGMKPQTHEHISIVELLGVKHGIVALSKADLADPEWIEIAVDILREELVGTVFAESPMILTSAKTGLGVPELKVALHRLAGSLPLRDQAGAFRLPLDKVFSIPGIGTVVSGTTWRGRIQVGDVLEVLPSRTSVRVRGLQTHGKPAAEARAGQRTAVNIVGIEKDQLSRGYVLAAPGTLTETNLLDVRIQLLEKAGKGLRHRDRVHIHLGTAEAIGRVLLLEADELQPGESSLAQVRLERVLVCEATDHFVLRSYSPVLTLGGGRVINPHPNRLHRRKRETILQQLAARDSDSPFQRLLGVARMTTLVTEQTVTQELGVTEQEAAELLAEGVQHGGLCLLPGGHAAVEVVESTLSQLERALRVAHQKRRFEHAVPRALLANALPTGFSSRQFDWLLAQGQLRNLWRMDEKGICSADWEVKLSPEEQTILKGILTHASTNGLGFVEEEELAKRYPNRDRIAKGLIRYAVVSGELQEVESGLYVHPHVLHASIEQLQDLYRTSGPFTAASARDRLGTGRKSAITLLEFLDRQGITKRRGDTRTLEKDDSL